MVRSGRWFSARWRLSCDGVQFAANSITSDLAGFEVEFDVAPNLRASAPLTSCRSPGGRVMTLKIAASGSRPAGASAATAREGDFALLAGAGSTRQAP